MTIVAQTFQRYVDLWQWLPGVLFLVVLRLALLLLLVVGFCRYSFVAYLRAARKPSHGTQFFALLCALFLGCLIPLSGVVTALRGRPVLKAFIGTVGILLLITVPPVASGMLVSRHGLQRQITRGIYVAVAVFALGQAAPLLGRVIRHASGGQVLLAVALLLLARRPGRRMIGTVLRGAGLVPGTRREDGGPRRAHP